MSSVLRPILAVLFVVLFAPDAPAGLSQRLRPAATSFAEARPSKLPESRPSSSGFVFDATGAATSSPGQRVGLGDKVPPQALRSRFSGYSVRVARGEDCLVCATVSGRAGTVEVGYAADGGTVTAISSEDRDASDILGNRVGGPLSAAVGEEAVCDNGMVLTCASPKLKGLDYVVADDGRCSFGEIDGRKPVRIPACAKIGGFSVVKSGR